MKNLVIVSQSAKPWHVKKWIRRHRPNSDEWVQAGFAGSNAVLDASGIPVLHLNFDSAQMISDEGHRLRRLLSVAFHENPTLAWAKPTELNFADEWWRTYIEALPIRRNLEPTSFKSVRVLGPGLLFRESLNFGGYRFSDDTRVRLLSGLDRLYKILRVLGVFLWNFSNVSLFTLGLAVREKRKSSRSYANRVVMWSTFPNAWAKQVEGFQSRILPAKCFPEGEPLHFVSCLYSNSERTKSIWTAMQSVVKFTPKSHFVEPHELLSTADVFRSYLEKSEVDYRSFAKVIAQLIGPGRVREHWLRFRLIDLPKCRLLAISASRLSREDRQTKLLNLVGFEFIESRAVSSGFRKSEVQVWGVQHGVATINHSWRLVHATRALFESSSDASPDRLLVEGRQVFRLFEPTWAGRVDIVGAPRLSELDLRPRPPSSGEKTPECLFILDMHNWERLCSAAVEMAEGFPEIDIVVCPHPSQKSKVARKVGRAQKKLSNLKLSYDTLRSAEMASLGVIGASGVAIELALKRVPLFSFCPPGSLDLSAIPALPKLRPIFNGTRGSFVQILDFRGEPQFSSCSDLDDELGEIVQTTDFEIFRENLSNVLGWGEDDSESITAGVKP